MAANAEITARQLEISYGETLVVSDLDIHIRKGEITTIIGPNGSGKSTVLKALTRLLKYRSGVVEILERDLKDYDTKELARLIGVLPQKHTAPPDFTVRDLVGYGRMPHQKWYERNSREDDAIVDWALEVTGTSHLAKKSIRACSGGEQQRVWIAMVLAQQPEILFLDEPTTYLDISHQQETMRLVKRLKRESGIGIVMVLHDLSHALEVSDYIVVIKDGKKYSEGTPLEVITPKMLREVYHVECQVVEIPGRHYPLLAYQEIS
mgnify:FL=1